MKLDYIGKELENFSVAKNWRKYVVYQFKNYLKDKNVLEVGSGIGSFTEILSKDVHKLTLLEPDKNFCKFLENKFKHETKIDNIYNGTIDDIKDLEFDVIVHFQVLEHLKEDNQEIINNLKLLKNGGHMLICVPSFMSLYSEFDRVIGHFKRYEKKDFKLFKIGNSKIEKIYYIDSIGYFVYRIFKIFINSPEPKKLMIQIWDKIFIPFSKVLDKLIFNRVGKNLIVVIKKF
jgi:2-polyprenyl-3-methyl-5-hydroxy-6-metoxy-1,4-benzoquinol methylase